MLDDTETLIGAVSGLMPDCSRKYKPLDSHANSYLRFLYSSPSDICTN